eukprot:1916580-Lingulodinium_polyedra.AAC.1
MLDVAVLAMCVVLVEYVPEDTEPGAHVELDPKHPCNTRAALLQAQDQGEAFQSVGSQGVAGGMAKKSPEPLL